MKTVLMDDFSIWYRSIILISFILTLYYCWSDEDCVNLTRKLTNINANKKFFWLILIIIWSSLNTLVDFIPSLAKHRMFWDRFGIWRCETDVEMIQRLLELKTGVWVDERDITACHPLGRRERNTYILSINNRTPLSSWDMITRGMMTAENNFSNANLFLNFQLTKKRGEICKEVRNAKKGNIVQSYEIDMNGRIFVKYVGTDNKSYEIINLEDIEKKKPIVNQ